MSGTRERISVVIGAGVAVAAAVVASSSKLSSRGSSRCRVVSNRSSSFCCCSGSRIGSRLRSCRCYGSCSSCVGSNIRKTTQTTLDVHASTSASNFFACSLRIEEPICESIIINITIFTTTKAPPFNNHTPIWAVRCRSDHLCSPGCPLVSSVPYI